MEPIRISLGIKMLSFIFSHNKSCYILKDYIKILDKYSSFFILNNIFKNTMYTWVKNNLLRPICHFKNRGWLYMDILLKCEAYLISKTNLYDKNTFLWLKIRGSFITRVYMIVKMIFINTEQNKCRKVLSLQKYDFIFAHIF